MLWSWKRIYRWSLPRSPLIFHRHLLDEEWILLWKAHTFGILFRLVPTNLHSLVKYELWNIGLHVPPNSGCDWHSVRNKSWSWLWMGACCAWPSWDSNPKLASSLSERDTQWHSDINSRGISNTLEFSRVHNTQNGLTGKLWPHI